MALGTLAGAAVGGLAAAGGSYALNSMFGSGSGGASAPVGNFTPTGINAGGFSTTFNDGRMTLAPSGERLGFVRGLQDVLGGQAGDIAALRAKVAPGMSDLRASRLGEIENARNAAIGNLRENLARRRVLGSSFGQDAITRAEAEFGGARDKVAAESFLQELEATNQLLNQEFAARRQQVQVGLDELNLEADAAIKLTAKATETLGQNARFMAELNSREAAARGTFFGQTFQPAIRQAGTAVGNYASTANIGGSPSGYAPAWNQIQFGGGAA